MAQQSMICELGDIHMALSLIYITNSLEVALIAEKYGVQRVMVDLETLGKAERQKGMDTVQSHHTVSDVAVISKALTRAEMLARVNPWNSNSEHEIEAVIAAGADWIMLPMWKNAQEVDRFLKTVDQRVRTILLLETKEAVECLDTVLDNPMVDEIYIGLNDLHLSYGMRFMFEPLANGDVEAICKKCQAKNIPYGFGGIARIGEGMLPAERIVMEHYRLGSTRVILSRSFCNTDQITDMAEIQDVFAQNMHRLREYEAMLETKTEQDYMDNQNAVRECVSSIVCRIKEKRQQ